MDGSEDNNPDIPAQDNSPEAPVEDNNPATPAGDNSSQPAVQGKGKEPTASRTTAPSAEGQPSKSRSSSRAAEQDPAMSRPTSPSSPARPGPSPLIRNNSQSGLKKPAKSRASSRTSLSLGSILGLRIAAGRSSTEHAEGQPLMGRSGSQTPRREPITYPTDSSDTASEGLPPPDPQLAHPPGIFLWVLTFSACISGLLFGYDTGVISAALVTIGKSLSDRELTSWDKSIITAITSLIALIVTPAASLVADVFGRKPVILLADIMFIAGAVTQALGSTVLSMIVGRGVVGAAVGTASLVTPLYIVEVAPPAYRGRLVTMNIVFITLGQVIAYLVGWLFAEYGDQDTAWRWMVGLGALPALFQLISFWPMPETPRWLLRERRGEEAKTAIRRIYGLPTGSPLAHSIFKNIAQDAYGPLLAQHARRPPVDRSSHWDWVYPNSYLWRDLFKIRRNRRALAIACLLQGLQQLCGFNSLMYYSATIFYYAGFPTPTLTSLVVAVTNFLFTLVALTLIDRVGRRRILLWSIPVMVAGLLIVAIHFRSIDPEPVSVSREDKPASRGAAIAIVVGIMVYVAGYATGLGNVPWMQSELFGDKVRAVGSSIATSTNWGANFIVGATFLILMDALTPTWTFVLYAFICTIGYVLIYRIFPEMTGLTLEEAAHLLEADDWGVSGNPPVPEPEISD